MINLKTVKWVPIIRSDGTREKISLVDILSNYKSNPIIRLDFARPDFNAFATQLLIGVYQSSLLPKDEDSWKDLLKSPPSKKFLDDAIDSNAFILDGDGFRFMQEDDHHIYEPEKHTVPIDYLIFGATSKASIKEKRDWWIKAGDINCMCPSCVTAALYIRQVNSYSAGQGYRTAFRSGNTGKVTTLITGKTLWETIVLNILTEKELKSYGNWKKPLYPWMNPKLSKDISNMDLHPCSFFWETPASIYLNFEKKDLECSICGEQVSYGVKTLLTRNGGRKVSGFRYSHSPYKMIPQKQTKEEKAQNKPVKYDTRHIDCCRQLTDMLDKTPAFVTELPYILKHLYEYQEFKSSETVRLFYNNGRFREAGLWLFGFDYERSLYRGWVETHLDKIPERFPEMENIIYVSIMMANSLHYYITRINGLNEFRRSKTPEKKDPNLITEFLRSIEPDIHIAFTDRDIHKMVENFIIKAFRIYDKYTNDQQLYSYGHSRMKESINKSLDEHGIKDLSYPEILVKEEERKIHSFRFDKDTRIAILKWWSWLKHQHSIRNEFLSCTEVEEMQQTVAVGRLMKICNLPAKNDNQERLARAGHLSLSIREHDWGEYFLTKIYSSHDSRIEYLSGITDPLKDWSMIYQLISVFKTLNIPNFIETIVYWDKKIKPKRKDRI